MLTYPGQNTPQHQLRARFEEIWPTIHGWIEGFFWGVVGFVRTLIVAMINTLLGR